jgi:hypothetical protein
MAVERNDALDHSNAGDNGEYSYVLPDRERSRQFLAQRQKCHAGQESKELPLIVVDGTGLS